MDKEEIEKELVLSQAYYNAIAINKKYSVSFWYAGYISALKVALGLENSKAREDFKELIPSKVIEMLFTDECVNASKD